MTNNRRSSLKFDELAKREQELAESSEYVDSDNVAKRAQDLKRAVDEADIDLNEDVDKEHKFPKVHDYGEKNASEFGE